MITSSPLDKIPDYRDTNKEKRFKALLNENIERLERTKSKFSALAAKVLMPSILFQKITEQDNACLARFIEKDPKRREHLFIETPDGIELESCIIKIDPKEQKWIVVLNPNAGIFQDRLDWLRSVSTDVEANVLAINYRETGNSTGTLRAARDLAVDGDTAVQYLKSLGVKPKNICLYGHSMGAAAATLTAYVQPKDAPIGGIVSDRSFGNLLDVANSIAGIVGKHAIKNTEWAIEVTNKWAELTGMRKVIVVDENDEMIKFKISLYSSLKEKGYSLRGMRILHFHNKLFDVEFEDGNTDTYTANKLTQMKQLNSKPIKKVTPIDLHNLIYTDRPQRFNQLVRHMRWALHKQSE